MQMNIKEMVEKIKSRELTSEALVQSYIEEITKKRVNYKCIFNTYL